MINATGQPIQSNDKTNSYSSICRSQALEHPTNKPSTIFVHNSDALFSTHWLLALPFIGAAAPQPRVCDPPTFFFLHLLREGQIL
jgi:hypothetical protein